MSHESKRRKAMGKRKSMKKRKKGKKRIETVFNIIPLIVVILVTAVILRYNYQQTDEDPLAPDFTVSDVITNRYYTLHATGLETIVVVSFFGTECPDCISHMQTLQQVRDAFSGEITIISIATWNSGDTVESLKAFAMDNEYRWFITLDTNGVIAQAYAVSTLPTTFVIDRFQRINFRRDDNVGFTVLENTISTLLKEQPRVVRAVPLALQVTPRLDWIKSSKLTIFQ